MLSKRGRTNLDRQLRRAIRHEQTEVGIGDIEVAVIPTISHHCPAAISHPPERAACLLADGASHSEVHIHYIYPLLILTLLETTTTINAQQRS